MSLLLRMTMVDLIEVKSHVNRNGEIKAMENVVFHSHWEILKIISSSILVLYAFLGARLQESKRSRERRGQ